MSETSATVVTEPTTPRNERSSLLSALEELRFALEWTESRIDQASHDLVNAFSAIDEIEALIEIES